MPTQVQIMDEAVCIWLHGNAFGKGINPSVQSLQWENSKVDNQPKRGKIEFKLALFWLKIVSHPAYNGGIE